MSESKPTEQVLNEKIKEKYDAAIDVLVQDVEKKDILKAKFDDIASAYDSNIGDDFKRHYHNLEHVDKLLETVVSNATAQTPEEQKHVALATLAIIEHDLIYAQIDGDNPKITESISPKSIELTTEIFQKPLEELNNFNGKNEFLSAALLADDLMQAGVEEKDIKETIAYIAATVPFKKPDYLQNIYEVAGLDEQAAKLMVDISHADVQNFKGEQITEVLADTNKIILENLAGKGKEVDDLSDLAVEARKVSNFIGGFVGSENEKGNIQIFQGVNINGESYPSTEKLSELTETATHNAKTIGEYAGAISAAATIAALYGAKDVKSIEIESTEPPTAELNNAQKSALEALKEPTLTEQFGKIGDLASILLENNYHTEINKLSTKEKPEIALDEIPQPIIQSLSIKIDGRAVEAQSQSMQR
jgi:hypothetical protein